MWEEFWITGDVDGWGDPVSNQNGPLDHDLLLLCARDTVKLLRNHPSLALWVGGNEEVPPDDINKALKNDQMTSTQYGNTINTFPIRSQKNVLIRLNFMEPQRILKIFL